MKRVYAALLLLAISTPAWAQALWPNFSGLSGNPNAQPLTAANLNAAFDLMIANGFDVRMATPSGAGALCNGSADDAAAINRALTNQGSLGGGAVLIPPLSAGCRFNEQLTVPANTYLVGTGWTASVLLQGTANLAPAILLNCNNCGVLNLEALAAPGVTNTSGTMIGSTIGAISGTRIQDVQIVNPCIGLDLNGNSPVARHVMITGVAGAACSGGRLGAATTGAGTVNPTFENVTIACSTGNPGGADLLLLDAGGYLGVHNSFSNCQVGTKIYPGLNQAVFWATLGSSYYGDGALYNAVYIDTADPTAQVLGVSAVDGWASSAGADGVLVKNTAGGTVAGVHFVGLRDYNNSGNGLDVYSGVTDLTVDASTFCGMSSVQSDIVMQSGASTFAIRNNKIGGACDGLIANTPVNGILLAGSNSNGIITGNDLYGAVNAATGVLTGLYSVVQNNSVLDTQAPNLASAATITVGLYSKYIITGTTGISTINGGWNGRTATFFPAGAGVLTFIGGGSICNSLTTTQYQPVVATYLGCWFMAGSVGSTGFFSGGSLVSGNALLAGPAGLSLQTAAGQPRQILTYSGANPRWNLYTDSSAESGSNAGSNEYLARYSDTGTLLDTPLAINRQSGITTLSDGLTVAAGGIGVTSGGVVITAGGAAITAGGLTVTAGGLTVSAGALQLPLNTGTPATYACFTSGGALISSASPC